jgi:[CysO sulfur-carrier protein]-S-L-cysteine hydrolase
MVIAAGLLDEMVAHARKEFEAECCGILACEPDGRADARRAVSLHRATNVFAGRLDAGGRDAGRKRFEIDGKEVLRVWNECEAAGLELGAIYHSHTHTDPYPSQTDVNFAANWPGVEWVILGLANGEPEVRCYLIEDGEIREVPLEVR